MLAWVNLLSADGYVNRFLGGASTSSTPRSRVRRRTSRTPSSSRLAYGYMPFIIVPLYATLDRIDERQLEASRDLGSGRLGTFLRVTLPLSRQGLMTAIVITALPMFGDYYTNTLVSGSPTTTMIGNEIEFYLLGSSQKAVGAVAGPDPVAHAHAPDGLLPAHHLAREQGGPMTIAGLPAATEVGRAELPDDPTRQSARQWRGPWRPPWFLATLTWGYIVWTLLPVLIASSSRSTRAGRAASGRGSRSGGTGETRSGRSGTTRACCSRSATA